MRTFFSSRFASSASKALLRLLDERHDVALLENPARHALRIELLERVGLFADADVLDRLLGDTVNRQRRATACVAVHLREDDAGHVQPRVEALRDLHRVLSGHAVGDEQDLVGMDRRLETLELLHHVVVDLQTAGRVDDHDAVAGALGLLDAGLRDPNDVLRVALGVHRDVELRAERFELIDGGWPIDVARHEARRPILGFELSGELGGGGRLSRSLETDHHHDRGRNGAELEPFAPFAEHRGELVVDDFDELLAWRDGANLRDADGFLLDSLEELPSQLEVDVGLEQNAPHLAEAFFDVGLGEHTAAAQAGEGRFKFL